MNYRKLNKIIIKNKYFLSNIGEFQDCLKKTQQFIKLDLQKIYNLIKIKKGEKWKTAFRTKYKNFEY